MNNFKILLLLNGKKSNARWDDYVKLMYQKYYFTVLTPNQKTKMIIYPHALS